MNQLPSPLKPAAMSRKTLDEVAAAVVAVAQNRTDQLQLVVSRLPFVRPRRKLRSTSMTTMMDLVPG